MEFYKKVVLRVFVLLGVSSALFAYKQEDLEKLIQTGNCERCDLSFIANLTKYIETIKKQDGTSLQAALDKKINLAGSDLSGSDLSFAPLQNCDLSGVTAVRTLFSRAQMFGCNLSESNLMGANFEDADLRNAQLDNVKGFVSGSAMLQNAPIVNPGLLRKLMFWPWN